MERRSLIEHLKNFDRYGRDTACVFRRGYRRTAWSYRDLARAARGFARELESRGIGKGDRVLIWGENCAQWVAAFWACVLRGAVVVPIDVFTSLDFACRVVQSTQAKLLVCSRRQTESAPSLPILLFEEIEQIVAQHPPPPDRSPELRPDEPLEIIFTSGTTGDPKGVVISHKNILANLQPIEREIQKFRKYERLVHPIRFLSPLPLSHLFGQFVALFVPPLMGATVIFQESSNPADVRRTIRKEQVSVLVTVPRLLESLKRTIEQDWESKGRLEWFREQLQAAEGEHFLRRWWRFRQLHRAWGWRFWAFLSSSATLDAETERFWTRMGFAVIQAYGLTETSLVSLTHPFKTRSRSIGQPVPGLEVQLEENGEILVRGDSVASGYWQEGELRSTQDERGWFRTGDIAERGRDGHLYFKGRRKDVIVTPEGFNLYPQDLEAVVRRQPEVRDCVVIGIPRNGNAEPCAVLILQDPAADAGALVRRANRSLADYQRVRHWVVWPEEDFPRSSTGKPRKHLIQLSVRPQPGIAQSTSSPLPELIARVKGRIPENLSKDAHLGLDLDLSSLDRVELLSALENRFQIELDETRFSAATTIAELEEMLREPQARRMTYVYPRWPLRWPLTWVRVVGYHLLIGPATLLLGYPRIRGRERLRKLRGPVLIVCNHVTFLDPGLILAALPFRFRHRLAIAMVGERLEQMRRPPAEWGWLQRGANRIGYFLAVTLLNVFPLPQKSGFREAFTFAGELPDRGYSILVFPEGGRTRDGKLAPFQSGAGLLAKNLDLPVVPVRIDGLFELKKAGRKVARPGAVRVLLGSPLRFDPDMDPKQVADRLREVVASL